MSNLLRIFSEIRHPERLDCRYRLMVEFSGLDEGFSGSVGELPLESGAPIIDDDSFFSYCWLECSE